MKRFWNSAGVDAGEDGWTVALDGKPLRTPAGDPLRIPSRTLAEAIAEEWTNAPDSLDPRELRLTGLANSAIDLVAANPVQTAANLAKYGESDLLCYRAEAPRELADRQEARWGSALDWARRRFDVDIKTTCGIAHVPQPSDTTERLAKAVAALDPFRLAGLTPIVSIGGSLIIALALLEQELSVEEAWKSVTLDEEWQSEQWGRDPEAEAALEARKREFFAAARFLELL